MQEKRFFFRAGSCVWIVGGAGHFILVDAFTLHGRTRVSAFVPRADILDAMETTTLTFGYLGSTTAFLATAGFSIWVALSLVLFGITYLLLSRQAAVVLRPFIYVGLAISTVFTLVAVISFIYPAALGGVLATTLFVAAWIRNES
ncbi:MAG: hypothetical protein AB7O44_29120 [Hyphomicrobiaceae bacterium]